VHKSCGIGKVTTYNELMRRSTRRLLALAAGLFAFVIGSALLYQLGMSRLEGHPRTFWQAFEWAAETLSTTGYGADNRWASPAMVILVVTVQFVGVFVIFLVVPIFMIPFLEERFEEKLPRTAGNITNHIIVYRYGPAVESLLEKLAHSDVPAIVVETDEAAARAVQEQQQRVVFSRTEEDALDACRLSSARALVANARDEENASIILRARQMGFRGDVIALVEDPAHRRPIELAGATAAYTPRHIIAAALAAHASDRISPRLAGAESLDGVEHRELRVPLDSAVAGKTLREAAVGQRSGAMIVGQWSRNRLLSRCDADMQIDPGSRLELLGTPDALDRAAAIIGARFFRAAGPVLIAGFGEVGRKVHELLSDVGEEVRVIERQQAPGVDLVGNVLDASVLERGGIDQARVVVLALNTDDATLFATVMIRDVANNIPVIARVNHSRNVENIYRAGADYALSIADISGEMLYTRLLGRSARTREEHRSITHVPVRALDGRTLRDSGIRAHGCSAVALRRNGSWLTNMTSETVLQAGDDLYICGTIEAFREISL
jgi:Trk K+ transport system NAD-binding subunit